jgi:hypothetical protein
MAALSPPQLSGYLKRIGLAAKHPSPPPPTLRTLADIQWAHLTTIPFENLSLRLEAAGQQFGISTDLELIYKKLVVGGRGGYCLEARNGQGAGFAFLRGAGALHPPRAAVKFVVLHPTRSCRVLVLQQNGLLGSALRSLGFEVLDAGARVVRSGGAAPEPPVLNGHDHRFLLVHIDGSTWMADVGFGSNSIPQPLLLPAGAELFPPYPGANAAEAYADFAWPPELPLARMQRYRLRLGLPNSLEVPDPASTPFFASRAGYYLQRYSEGAGDATWRDLFFFRCVPAAQRLLACCCLACRQQSPCLRADVAPATQQSSQELHQQGAPLPP